MDKEYGSYGINTRVHKNLAQRSLWNRIWKDRHGRTVIYQRPNLWLILWFVLELISLLAPSHGTVENVCWWLATASLEVWAILEFLQGANYFRRILGFIIGLLTLLTVFNVGL
jgi:hypothetical protein